MPFKSKSQKAYLNANEPEVAKEFYEHTPKSVDEKLPEYVRDKNRLKQISKKHRRLKNG